MTTHEDRIADLAPFPEAFDPAWSLATRTRILADPKAGRTRRPHARWRAPRRRALVIASALTIGLTGGAAFAVTSGNPLQAVKETLTSDTQVPNSSSHGIGKIGDPLMVAKFQVPRGLFSVWYAMSSNGTVCIAYSDATWDGRTPLSAKELDRGCGSMIYDYDAPGQVGELKRPDQIGGFFKDADGPVLYGVAPSSDAVQVKVQGVGIDRILPLRPDSHGYGASLPEASSATQVTLTFLDARGRTVGTKRWVAPVG